MKTRPFTGQSMVSQLALGTWGLSGDGYGPVSDAVQDEVISRARAYGITLFETADALEHGATVLDKALRSPHYRAYLKTTGRLALQFGYSDSGRYVGQIAASYLIERLRL